TPVINGPARIKVAAGVHPLTAALVDPTTSAGVNDLYSTFPRKGAIFSIIVNGPFQPTGPGSTASREKIFICRPHTPADEVSCARRIVTRLAGRAFRMPLAEDSTDVS